MQEDRDIKHSLHIQNVQELIEKEKVTTDNALKRKVNKSGLEDPGSPREMANDKDGSTARDDLDRVPLT